jgi:hypothetical protein
MQLLQPDPSFLILLILLIAGGGLLLFFHIRALLASNLRPLRNVTLVIAITGIAVYSIFFTSWIHWSFTLLDYFPLRMFIYPTNENTRLTLHVFIVALLVLLIFSLRRKKYLFFLYLAWSLFLFCSLGDFLYTFYLFTQWSPPAPANTGDKIMDAIMSHTGISRETYLARLIYPFCWMVLSVFSLVKVRRTQSAI